VAILWKTKQALLNCVAKGSLAHKASLLTHVGAYIPEELNPSDYTTYVKADPNNDFTVTATQIIVDTMRRDVKAYLYLDMGADYFDGDFEHKLDFELTAYQDWTEMWVWVISTKPDSGFYAMRYDCLALGIYYSSSQGTVRMVLFSNSPYGGVYWNGAEKDVHYYVTITRVGALLTCKVYSNPERTNLLATLTRSLTAGLKYRYIYAVVSQHHTSFGSNIVSGYVQNLQGV